MTATLPSELREVFERSATAELVTIDRHGRPVARSVAPSYHHGEICIDVPRAEPVHDPRVALLFGGEGPMVLVQGTAAEDVVVHVRPERVFAWQLGDPEGEPRLFDAHLEEVRSGHNEEPEIGHAEPEGGGGMWDDRLERVEAGMLACVAPDGFPFAAHVTVEPQADEGLLLLPHVPIGMPVEPGPAFLHCPDGARVTGDLLPHRSAGWGLLPHAVLGAAGD
jgi:hypothetical protein